MKKMSILAVLLVAVVVTTFSVSGTYAKYTSKIDTTDEARIAKWEFGAAKVNDDNTTTALSTTQTNTIDLFASSYKWNGDKYVEAINKTDKVVAPGTAGEYTFKLVGDMEVRYNLKFDLKVTNDFVVYYNVVDGKVTDISNTKTNQTNEYHPVKFSIEYTDNAGTVHNDPLFTDLNTKGLADALTVYSNKIAAKGFGPGAMKQQYKISWKWDVTNTISGLDAVEVNKLDTWAGQNMSIAEDKVVMDLTITATQIAENYSK